MSSRLRLGLQALALAGVAGLLALLIWKVVADNGGGAAAELSKGKVPPAPSFELPRLDREGSLELASLRGKVVVLNFWASWCAPCKEEAPELQAAFERWRGRDVAFVGINSKDFKSDGRRFMRRYGMRFPNVRDGSGKLWGPYGVTALPETFFISRGGKVVERYAGRIPAEELEAAIRRARAA
jgi:cytochrome c biogenesis protein CcmG/thiol:disulfide interchange protein DsbE